MDALYTAKFGSGTDIRSLGWGSPESQQIRFQVLLDLDGRADSDRILDVGCGYGDLSTWVQAYTGIDVRSHALREAARRYPGIDVRLATVDTVGEPYDWVVASGLFAFAQPEWEDSLVSTVRTMLALATRGVAINLLSARTPNKKDPDMMYADPDRVLDLLRPLAPRVDLREGYLVNDLTVYLYPRIESRSSLTA